MDTKIGTHWKKPPFDSFSYGLSNLFNEHPFPSATAECHEMKFVILGFDGPEGQAKRKIHRPAHIERLERWNLEGRIVLAGPFTDQVGSLSVIEAHSLKEAEEFAREDPGFMSAVMQGPPRW